MRFFAVVTFSLLFIGTASAQQSPSGFPSYLQFRVTGGSGFIELDTPYGLPEYELPIGASVILSTGQQSSAVAVTLHEANPNHLSCTDITPMGTLVYQWRCTAIGDAGSATNNVYFKIGSEYSNYIVLKPRAQTRAQFSIITSDTDNGSFEVYLDRQIGSPARIQYEVFNEASQLIHANGKNIESTDDGADVVLGDVFRADGGTNASFTVKFSLCARDATNACYDFQEERVRYTGQNTTYDAIADIAVTVQFPPEEQWSVKPQTTFTLPITITNHGPADVNSASIYTQFDPRLVETVSLDASCTHTHVDAEGKKGIFCDIDTLKVRQSKFLALNFRLLPDCSKKHEVASILVGGNSPWNDSSANNNALYVNIRQDCAPPQGSSSSLRNSFSSRTTSVSSATTTAPLSSSSNSKTKVRSSSSAPASLRSEGGFLQSVIDNKTITLKDVRADDWYAVHVHTLMSKGIVSGYRDAQGHPLGTFGPGDSVTYAQIAKMTIEMIGLAATGKTEPRNLSAKGQWSAIYVAEMEKRDITPFLDANLDVNSPAPRGAVLQILVEMNGLGIYSPKGTYYEDVLQNTPYAAYVERMTDQGIVSGDAGGKTFRPLSSINRAETTKIFSKMIEVFHY